jgi:hypothetical protein
VTVRTVAESKRPILEDHLEEDHLEPVRALLGESK